MRGIVLREAASVLAAVYMLLLGPGALCAAQVGFVWTANTDHTTEYRVFTRAVGGPAWGDIAPTIIPGVTSTTVAVELTPGPYEATIAAYSDSYFGEPITPQQSDYAPLVAVFVAPETCQEVQGFRVQ